MRREKLQKAREEETELFENVSYNEAMKEKSRIEDRIAELEEVLNNYELIRGGSTDVVSLGSTVVVRVGGELTEFTIVGSLEADPPRGYISNESPVGKALLGSKRGQTIQISSTITTIYEVVEIR